jgi:glycosyltransferase involved in cell wall biosynthesis
MPKLSIVTVNLNNSEGLEKTIKSIQNQTFKNFEHIIIDGGSIDNSLNVIRDYNLSSKDNDYELYWSSESDLGIYNAMNKGIKVSKGEYIQFLNSGDLLHSSNSLNIMNRDLKDELIIGNEIVKDGSNEKLHQNPDTINTYYVLTNRISHAASFFRRDIFDRYGGYDESFRIAGDYHLFLKLIFKHKVSYSHIEHVISIFETDGISSNPRFEKIRLNEKDLACKQFIQEPFYSDLKELAKYKIENELLLRSRFVSLALKMRNAYLRMKQINPKK